MRWGCVSCEQRFLLEDQVLAQKYIMKSLLQKSKNALRQAQGERISDGNHFLFAVRGEPVEPPTLLLQEALKVGNRAGNRVGKMFFGLHMKSLRVEAWAMKRISTRYPGVLYREATRLGGPGTEKVFYIVFKKDGKVLEEKVGRQYADDMTEARANRIRAERIEGKRSSPKEMRQQERERKQAEQNRWAFDRLWEEYKAGNPDLKGIVTDENRYQKHIRPLFGTKEPHQLVPLDVVTGSE
jgi:hypothetical protein